MINIKNRFSDSGSAGILLAIILLLIIPGCYVGPDDLSQAVVDDHGAVIRTDTTKPVIHLVFTGHDYAEGFPVVHETLKKHGIKGSFFFTGDFYRDPGLQDLILTLVEEDHYLGAHSDKHLLYCSWENRDSLLVSKAKFRADLIQNYREMERFGIRREDARWFMPPYEWYNKTIAGWTEELGLVLVNFTPGTRSNADYTYPEMGSAYVDSETIMQNILSYEVEHGMNGFILLIHLGTDPRRKDKLYNRMDELIEILKGRGYYFKRIDE